MVEEPLLIVKLNGKKISQISESELPCEKTLSAEIVNGGVLEFIEHAGKSHRHELVNESGWCHFSIRVHKNYACQADCVITASQEFDQSEFLKGGATGIRFQPFFISGSEESDRVGRGLFHRGLHFSGTVTPRNVILSCECDCCHKSFLIQSFHAGFSEKGYFYSDSGTYTLVVSTDVPGCPKPFSAPDPTALAELESHLPKAPDGTSFQYLNPFRCPHCKAPYIDFEGFPEQRVAEYYGNHFLGISLESFRNQG